MNTARALLILLVAVMVGFVGYQIGITQNVVALPAASGAPVAYYGYPYHWGFGFGFFGFLFPLFFLFLFFGLLRAAFGGGRGWGRHSYGYGRGPWGDEARSRIEDLHRELHGEKPRTDRPGGSPPTST